MSDRKVAVWIVLESGEVDREETGVGAEPPGQVREERFERHLHSWAIAPEIDDNVGGGVAASGHPYRLALAHPALFLSARGVRADLL